MKPALTVIFKIGICLFLSLAARAEAKSEPIWSCGLIFEAKGDAAALTLISYYEMSGGGHIDCVSTTGREARFPVQVKLGGLPVQPNESSMGNFHIEGKILNLSVKNPAMLLGSYTTANNSRRVISGMDAEVVLKKGDEQSVNMQVTILRGYGAKLGVKELSIQAIN